jgi:hypothetical protein
VGSWGARGAAGACLAGRGIRLFIGPKCELLVLQGQRADHLTYGERTCTRRMAKFTLCSHTTGCKKGLERGRSPRA